MKWVIAILFFLVCSGLNSQDFSLTNIPFRDDQVKSIAFAGGLRAPQFSQADLNLDGNNDIIIFDREGAIIIPLIYQSNGYSFDPSYRELFPKAKSWLLMKDFNGDGIQDIFCSPTTISIPGIELWMGEVINGKLSYRLRRFPDKNFDVLHIPIGSSNTQIFVSPIDIPAIEDVDGDGDVDILSFEPSGQSVYWYKNQTVDFNLSRDSVNFRIGDQCYGKFIESGFSQVVNLSPSETDCANAFRSPDQVPVVIRHSGSTVTAINLNDDDLKDLLIGDVSYDGIVALYNNGIPTNAWMTEQVERFPEIDPIDIELFNAVFEIKLANDPSSSLIVAPNDRFSSQTAEHIWLYDKNTEVPSAPFQLRTKSFLIDDMIYLGEYSSPLFWDYNSDGLMDLLIGSAGLSPDGIMRNPSLRLYENKGSAVNPSYELVNSDYAGLSRFKDIAKSYSPTIGDLDADGDFDLIVGDETGRLIFVENISGSKTKYNWGNPVYEYMGIRVSAYAKPEIYDYNKDGLGDLIVGEQNFNSKDDQIGSLNYFQNQGSAGSAFFEPNVEIAPNDPYLGRFFMAQSGFVSNYAAPRIVHLPDRDILAIGSQSGHTFIWDELQKDSFKLVSTSFGNLREGFISSISIADIDSDGYGEIAIGTRRGGIAIYNTDLKLDTATGVKETNELSLSIYPNPGSLSISVSIPSSCADCYLSVYASDGKLVHHETFQNRSSTVITTAAWTSDVYLVKIYSHEKAYIAKAVITN